MVGGSWVGGVGGVAKARGPREIWRRGHHAGSLVGRTMYVVGCGLVASSCTPPGEKRPVQEVVVVGGGAGRGLPTKQTEGFVHPSCAGPHGPKREKDGG